MAVLRSKEALRLCRGARAGPGGTRATACLTGESEASAGSSVDPAWTEHRRACPGPDPGDRPQAGGFAGVQIFWVLLYRLTKVPRPQRSGAKRPLTFSRRNQSPDMEMSPPHGRNRCKRILDAPGCIRNPIKWTLALHRRGNHDPDLPHVP